MSVPDRVRPGAVGLLALGSLGYAVMTLSWFSLPAYLPTITADLGLTETQAGALAGAVPLTYVPVALVSGLLVDRLGHRRTLGGGLVFIGFAHLGRSYAEGFLPMLALTVLLGVGGTGVTFGLPKLVAGLFPSSRVGVASTVYLLGSYAGTAAAFSLARPVVGPMLGGWRPLFRLTGLAVLGVALLWALAAVMLARGESATGGTDSPVAALREVFASQPMRLLVVVGFVYLLVAHGLQGMLPTVLDARGVTPAAAARITTLLVVAQVVGVLAIPAASDAVGHRRAALVGSVALCTLGVATLTAGVATLLPVLLVGLGLGGISPLIRALPAEIEGIGAERTGVAVGMVFAVGEIGGFLGPFAIGALGDLTGSFTPGLALLGVGTLAALAAGAALDV
ncbi:MFS transporter [Halorarius litoreus]|uniref:MFS transporter n=1 Tax=Halorarius litoreus TaxID=2962676 RepID=UPI0020CDD2EE|nr:MFS transporter [Halorarius litoreus]